MGRIVHTEAQNSFRLEGATVTISGKPDLIITSASDPTYVLIIDVKTGQECPSHAAQLMIYLYALPKALQQYRDAKIRGEAFYPTRTHVVGRGSLDQGFIRRLVALIQRIAAEPPPTTASASECRFCDITANDCPDRLDGYHEPTTGDTTDF